jgi:hypothetical protein
MPSTGTAALDASLAPLSTVGTADQSAPLPRFAGMTASLPAFSVNSCTAPSLSGSIVCKTGPRKARVWTIDVSAGAGSSNGAQIDGFTLTQTAGAACTPIVTSPASFPLALGDIPANQSASAPITIDFTGCFKTARFNVNIPLAANGGSRL